MIIRQSIKYINISYSVKLIEFLKILGAENNAFLQNIKCWVTVEVICT